VGRGVELPTRSSDEQTWKSRSQLISRTRKIFENQIEIPKSSKIVPKLDAHKYRKLRLSVIQSARGLDEEKRPLYRTNKGKNKNKKKS
jgi:hypothetical protein